MKETDLRGRACVMPVAVAAGLGMAGMGLVSSGIAAADTTSITDTLSLAVEETCTFKNTTDATFTGSALNGSEVENFNDSGVHTFYLFCNNQNGYTVSATPYDLTATNTDDVISYTANYTHTGADGMWTAAIATSEAGVTVTTPVPEEGGVVLSSSTHSSDSMSFTATYGAYVGTKTSAGTYTGTIEYTLSSLSGTVNNGGSGSGDNSGSGSGETGQNNGSGDNGGEETDNNGENGGGSGDSGDSGSGSNGGNSGSGDSGSSNEEPANANSGDSNGTQSLAPMALNNTYNTYGATTYNTNYSGGSSTPATTGTQSTTGGTTSGSGSTKSNNTGTGSSYENPLGVKTTTTAASDEGSGIDLAPLIATGAALAVAGVGAVALAKSNKEEEEKK